MEVDVNVTSVPTCTGLLGSTSKLAVAAPAGAADSSAIVAITRAVLSENRITVGETDQRASHFCRHRTFVHPAAAGRRERRPACRWS